jgi:hypothetical protein
METQHKDENHQSNVRLYKHQCIGMYTFKVRGIVVLECTNDCTAGATTIHDTVTHYHCTSTFEGETDQWMKHEEAICV